MTKEKLIEKYLDHREAQAHYADRRYSCIQSEIFINAMYYELMMHYHQDEMDKILDYIYENEWDLDLLRARWVW
jgi:hypothetical protein